MPEYKDYTVETENNESKFPKCSTLKDDISVDCDIQISKIKYNRLFIISKASRWKTGIFSVIVLMLVALVISLNSMGYFSPSYKLGSYANSNKIEKIIRYIENNYEDISSESNIKLAITLLANKNDIASNKYLESLLIAGKNKPDYIDEFLLKEIQANNIFLPSINENLQLLKDYIQTNINTFAARAIMLEILTQIATSKSAQGLEYLEELLYLGIGNPGYMDEELLSIMNINNITLQSISENLDLIGNYIGWKSLNSSKKEVVELAISHIINAKSNEGINYLEDVFTKAGGNHLLNTSIIQAFNEANLTLKNNKFSALSLSEVDITETPYSVEDFEKVLLYMASSGNYEYSIRYKSPIDKDYINKAIDNCKNAYTLIFAKYPEYCAFFNAQKIEYSNGEIKIKLSNSSFTDNESQLMIDEFHKEVNIILSKLINENKINETMTDRQKAEVLYRWMAYNLQYDLGLSRESYTGYGAAVKRIAVCQGYTALYNMLCKKVGIEVEGVPGTTMSNGIPGNHIWTLATLDGHKVYIDSTFSDPVPNRENYCDMRFFAVDSIFLSKTHEWDRSLYGSY